MKYSCFFNLYNRNFDKMRKIKYTFHVPFISILWLFKFILNIKEINSFHKRNRSNMLIAQKTFSATEILFYKIFHENLEKKSME